MYVHFIAFPSHIMTPPWSRYFSPHSLIMEASFSSFTEQYFERTYDRFRSVTCKRKILFNFDWIHIQDYFGLRPTFDGLPFCFRKYRTASISSSSFLFSPSLFDCWFGLDDDEEPGPEPAMAASFFCCLLPQFPIRQFICKLFRSTENNNEIPCFL